MSGFVSVGSTNQTTDIFVCRRHVDNIGLTRCRQSVMLANHLAVGVMLVRPVTKIGKQHIQQLTQAGGGNGRQ
jgi:hypothetical protein